MHPAGTVTGFSEHPYVRKALEEEAAAVASAVEGTRNDTLNRSAFALGQLVGAGVLAEPVAVDVLRDAARQAGLPASEAARTITSGLAAGHQQPRDMPPLRATPNGQHDTGTKKKEERSRPPVVDRRVYRGVLADLVWAADPTTEADPIGVYATLLAGTGVLIGEGGPYVQVGNTRHPLLIWPLLFGRTGSGRKGEASGTAAVFLRTVPGYDTLTVSGLSSGEGLIERIRDPDDDGDGGTIDKRLLVIEEEFAAVMARAKREGSTLAAVLRQAWQGAPLHVLNRRALTAAGSHIGIVGHITPREFRARLAETEMAGGSYNRFLPLFVERSKRLPIPAGIPPEEAARLRGQLIEAIAAAKQLRRIQLSAEAHDLWCDVLYDEMTAADDDDQVWTEFTRRAAPYCLRIAALTSALAGHSLTPRADLEAAGLLVRYAIDSARYVLDRQSRNPRLDRLRRALTSAGTAGLPRSDLSALFSRNLPKPALDELLAELVTAGEVEPFQVATGGRPAERYRLTEEPR